jgi:hypothetical protein
MGQGHGKSVPAAPITTANEAAASFNDLVLSDADLAGRTHEELLRAHHQRGLMIRDRPLCNVLRPRFVSGAGADELSQASEVIARVLERAGRSLLQSDRMLDRVGASDAEREIWSIDPGYDGLTLTSRLDSFISGGRIQFIEYNAESPAAIGFSDCLTEVFEDLPAMTAWGRAPKQAADGRARLLDVLSDAYRDWGGKGTPSVAVVDWMDVITRRDFELCAELFQQRGVATIICDPRELTRDRTGRVSYRGERIDLIYRRVLLDELLGKADEAQPLLAAYRDGAVCMVNSPRSKLLHKKTVFAMLSEGTLGVDVTGEEQAAIDNTVPWTRCVAHGQTTYHGETVELMALLRDQKDRFVFKPVDDYGGRGIVLGWESSEKEWEHSLETSPEGGLVVQERTEVPEEDFPVWEDGRPALARLMLDADPFLFKGRMGGILTRLSGSAVLNVTAGTGSSTPTFVLREE